MYIFKSCPKCHGDLTLEQDEHSRNTAVITKDSDFSCLQCGYRLGRSERRALLVRMVQAQTARSLSGTFAGAQGAALPAA